MRIALISDIHSNIYAFDAVLKTLKNHSADINVFLGDIVYGGVYPGECLAGLLDMDNLITVKGNADGKFDEVDVTGDNSGIKDHIVKIHRWVRAHLTEEEISSIRAFKFSEILETEGLQLGFYHGSPKSYNDRIYDDDPEELVSDLFKETDHGLAAVGNTHVRTDWRFDKLRVINPGAVGISNDLDTRAACGILDIEKDRLNYQQLNIEYPVESYIRDLESSDMPYREMIADQLRTGEPNKCLFRDCSEQQISK